MQKGHPFDGGGLFFQQLFCELQAGAHQAGAAAAYIDTLNTSGIGRQTAVAATLGPIAIRARAILITLPTGLGTAYFTRTASRTLQWHATSALAGLSLSAGRYTATAAVPEVFVVVTALVCRAGLVAPFAVSVQRVAGATVGATGGGAMIGTAAAITANLAVGAIRTSLADGRRSAIAYLIAVHFVTVCNRHISVNLIAIINRLVAVYRRFTLPGSVQLLHAGLTRPAFCGTATRARRKTWLTTLIHTELVYRIRTINIHLADGAATVITIAIP